MGGAGQGSVQSSQRERRRLRHWIKFPAQSGLRLPDCVGVTGLRVDPESVICHLTGETNCFSLRDQSYSEVKEHYMSTGQWTWTHGPEPIWFHWGLVCLFVHEQGYAKSTELIQLGGEEMVTKNTFHFTMDLVQEADPRLFLESHSLISISQEIWIYT